jgi:hypothetical protein
VTRRVLLVVLVAAVASPARGDVQYCPQSAVPHGPLPTTAHQFKVCEFCAARACRLCRLHGRNWFGTPFCQGACALNPCSPPLPTIAQCCAAGFPVNGPDGTSLCAEYCVSPCAPTP